MTQISLDKYRKTTYTWIKLLDDFMKMNIREAEIILNRLEIGICYSGLRNSVNSRKLPIYVKRDQTSELNVNKIILIRKDI